MRLLSICIFLVSLIIRQILKAKFARYSETILKANLTGADVAAKMLYAYNIHDIQISTTAGQLTDHYNPVNKTVNLSEAVFHGKNAAAAAVAAHECGHAVQHAKGYAFLQMRSMMVPVLSFTTQYIPWLILLGVLMVQQTLIPLKLGIGLFSLTTLFTVITLPVEFNASNIALNWLKKQDILTSQEYSMAKNALWWAAMTYVLAALGAIAELLYLVSKLTNKSSR
jgi:Zn-dependent membrane protease YugP